MEDPVEAKIVTIKGQRFLEIKRWQHRQDFDTIGSGSAIQMPATTLKPSKTGGPLYIALRSPALRWAARKLSDFVQFTKSSSLCQRVCEENSV